MLVFRYFMIDGSECTTPGRIEGVTLIKANTNYHHPKQGECFYQVMYKDYI